MPTYVIHSFFHICFWILDLMTSWQVQNILGKSCFAHTQFHKVYKVVALSWIIMISEQVGSMYSMQGLMLIKDYHTWCVQCGIFIHTTFHSKFVWYVFKACGTPF